MNFETIVLRFRDLVTAENETIAKHLAVINKHGYVWWGWWKKGNEKIPLDEFSALRTMANSGSVNIYLVDSGQNLAHCAVCDEIKFRIGEEIPSPEQEKTPEYYRNRHYPAWFRFVKIEPYEGKRLTEFSYVDCPALFRDENTNYSRFDGKKIYSIPELIQQNRTVWFVRRARDSDRDNEIILLDSDIIQPVHFSTKYFQSPGDRIIWLSDLHLPDSKFELEGGTPRQTLVQHLLKQVEKDSVAGLLISGDITSCAKETGFRRAQKLLQGLNYEIPALNSENILICPGNHDFKWEDSDLASGEKPAFIFDNQKNAIDFSNFYHSVYKLNPNKFFACGKKLLLSSGHILEIAALNSLMLQQYPNFEGHGYVSQEQLDFVADGMGWNSGKYKNAIRIVMMHHHYLPTCYTEEINVTRASSVVYDANRLMYWLAKYNVKLLLHGHKHKSFVSQISCPTVLEQNITTQNMRHITVVGMGSTGAAETDNKFAVIHFEQHEMVIEFHKIYSDESAADAICQTVKILYE